MESYILGILVTTSVFAILAISLDLLIGYTGLFTIVHGALFGAGAYASAILTLRYGLPFPAGLLAGALCGGLISLMIAVPSLRISGHYLVLASFGVQEILASLFLNLDSVTGGPGGLRNIPRPRIAGFVVESPVAYLLLDGAILALLLAGALALVRSPFGLLLRAVREDELTPQALGKNVVALKIKVFVCAGVLAGMAGSLYAHHITFISPEAFDVHASIFILSMVLIGGMGTLWGPVAGAALLVVLPEALRFLPFSSTVLGPARQIVYGALLVLFCFLRPQGLLGRRQVADAEH
jgi:branched-chain amino acid transport system permease protein